MAVTSGATLTMIDYSARFRGYIAKSAQYLLVAVRQAGPILSPGDRDQALHTLSYALKLSELWPDARALLLSMAPKMEQAGYRDEWMPYLEQGLRQSRQLGDAVATGELHLQLGLLYQLRSKYGPAREHLEASATEFERLNARRDQAWALNRLAYVARLQRRFEEATRLAETALRLLGEEDEERAFSYYVLGLIAFDNRAWQEALDHTQKSFNLWEQVNNRRMMGRNLLCLGAVSEKMKRFPAALSACQQAISLFDEDQDFFYKAIAQMNLGNVYLALEQFSDALENYKLAERIFRQVQDLLHLAMVNHNMGLTYRRLQEWFMAKEAYSTAIEWHRRVGNIALLVGSMDGLGLVYLGQNQLPKAIAVFEEALERLAQIEGESAYTHLFEMIASHLREASKGKEKVTNC